jgi:hypothetical protein
VVDDAFGDDGSADAPVDHSDHLEHTGTTVRASRDPVTDADRRGGLRRIVVDPDVAASAGFGRRGTALVQAHGPEPSVDPCRLHWCMVPRSLGRGQQRPPSVAMRGANLPEASGRAQCGLGDGNRLQSDAARE